MSPSRVIGVNRWMPGIKYLECCHKQDKEIPRRRKLQSDCLAMKLLPGYLLVSHVIVYILLIKCGVAG